jgi:hypothetical protein
LYNYFGSSPLKNQWRVIYEYMKEQDLLDQTLPRSIFNESKHNGLCSELKQLYVAVSRTRQRLWICEKEDCCRPMFDYGKKKCLVQVKQLDDSLAQEMQVASSPEEWTSRGIKVTTMLIIVTLYFLNKLFSNLDWKIQGYCMDQIMVKEQSDCSFFIGVIHLHLFFPI